MHSVLKGWAVAKRIAFWAAVTVIGAVGGNFFISLADERGWYKSPGERVTALITWLPSMVGSQWFHWMSGGVIGFTIGAWLDSLSTNRDMPSAPVETDRPDTFVRLERDRSATYQWRPTIQKNVFSCFQIYNYKPTVTFVEYGVTADMNVTIPELFPTIPDAIKDKLPVRPEQIDTFYIMIETPVDYRFRIETFGQEFPKHDVYNTTKRGAILYCRDPIPESISVFEIHFDPPMQ